MTRHGMAPGQGSEFTLCGRAFDDIDSGDADGDEPVVFAKPGQWIDCEECRDYVKAIKDNFTYQGRVKQ